MDPNSFWNKIYADAAAKKEREKASNTQWQDADYVRQQAQQGIANAQNRTAPQAAAPVMADQSTGRINSFITNLQGIASGQQMGAGELAARRQGQQAYANAIGAATMNRGANAVNGGRAAARAAVGIGQQTSGMSQQAALSDQQAANAALGQGIAMGQSGELARGQINQATQFENLRAKLQQMGLNDQAQQAYLSQLGGLNQSELAARINQANQPSGWDKLLGVGGQLGAAVLS